MIAPEYQQELLRPSSSRSSPKLYVAAVAKANSGNAPGGKHRWDPPLRSLLDEAADIAPLRPVPNYLEHDDLIRDEFRGISNSSTTIITSRETESSFRGSDFCRALDLARGQLGPDEILLYDDVLGRAQTAFDQLIGAVAAKR